MGFAFEFMGRVQLFRREGQAAQEHAEQLSLARHRARVRVLACGRDYSTRLGAGLQGLDQRAGPDPPGNSALQGIGLGSDSLGYLARSGGGLRASGPARRGAGSSGRGARAGVEHMASGYYEAEL